MSKSLALDLAWHSGLQSLPSPLAGTVLTMGSFDGVHLGHRQLVGRAVEVAKDKQLPSVVLTFDPHPLEVLRPDQPFFRLFGLDDQAEQLNLLGVDHFVVEKFTKDLARVEAEEFLVDWIQPALNPRHIVAGYDFVFGAGRSGTLEWLQRRCGELGIGVTVLPALQDAGGIVSSSRIRQLIQSGEVEGAQQLLGRPYSLSGSVIHGEARGRTIGVPTANIQIGSDVVPRPGVYFTRTFYREQIFDSVSNLGLRPTFQDGDAQLCLETFIFAFQREIYGERLTVQLLKFHRDERRFATVSALQEQIEKDVESAKSFFSGEHR